MIRQICIPPSDLTGVLYANGEKYKTVIVFLSGFVCAKQEVSYMFASMAKRLEGIHSILFDYYGCSDSPGEIEEITVETMLRDARSVIRFVKSMYPTFKLYLAGKGLSVHILKKVAMEFEIDGCILFDGLKSVKFPFAAPIGVDKVEFRTLMDQSDPEYSRKFSDWMESLGADEMDLLTEDVNGQLFDQLELLDEHPYRYGTDNILWFLSDETNGNLPISESEFYYSGRGAQNHPFRSPEIILNMTNKLQEWLARSKYMEFLD